MTDKVSISPIKERDLIKNPTREEFLDKMKEVTLMQNSIAQQKVVQWRKLGTNSWVDYIPGNAGQPEFHDFNYQWQLAPMVSCIYLIVDGESGRFLRSYGWKDPDKALNILRTEHRSYKKAAIVRFILDKNYKPIGHENP